jgi:flagella basal body P-ring formation protein FlgA
MKTALAILLLGLSAVPAAAQYTGSIPHPRLKPDVTVSGEIVRIDDLFENAGVAGNTPIFRAPDLGQTGTVPARQILDAVRPYGLIAVDLRGLSEVSVTRAGRMIAADDVEGRIARALAGRYNLGSPENLKLTYDRELRAIYLDTATTGDLSLARLNYDAYNRRFDAVFELTSGGRAQWRFTGLAVESMEAAITTRALARGEIVKAGDVVIERRAKSEFANEPPAPAAEVVGLAVRRAVRAGQPLHSAELAKPEIIHRGDMVTLHYEVPGIVISMRGKATENGALGDTVSVLNEQSKRTIQGVVSSPGHVTVVNTVAATRVAAPVAESSDDLN